MSNDTSASATQAVVDATNLTPQAGDVPQTTLQEGESQKPSRSAEDYEKIIADLRRENAERRTKLNKFEEEARKQEDARLSKEQLLEKRLAEMQAQREQEAETNFVRSVTQEAIVSAAELGIDPGLMKSIANFWQSIEIDDDGNPTNVRALVEQLSTSFAALRRNQPTTPVSAGATNPSRQETSAVPQEITREFLASLTPEQYAKLPREVQMRVAETAYTQPWKRR